MIKICVLLFVSVVLLGRSVIAAPHEDVRKIIAEEASLLESSARETLPEELESVPTRSRRATCQIPIIGDWVSDSACAAGCIARGRAGGHCRNEICHCREDMMLDLLRKRFNF